VRPSSGARSPNDAPEDGGREFLQLPFPPSVRLVLFGGKGGVGKTTCAAATALVLARQEPARRILLLSVDPAHSLGDVLGARVTEARARALPENLRVRELDATRQLAVLRESHEELLQRLVAPPNGVGVQPAFDRDVLERLLDLAPPGLDELMALVAVARALGEPGARGEAYDLVVVDSAPTGHALRLLALPDLAGRWTRALLELLREYREIASLEEMAPPLLELSRGLRDVVRLLRDPLRTRFVAVTRAAVLPRLETLRLLSALRRLRVGVAAVVVDALTPPGCRRCRRDAAREDRETAALRRALRSRRGGRCTMVLAPAVAPPPRGPAALARWTRSWRLALP
jgi:arsenite-transporting ATPase